MVALLLSRQNNGLHLWSLIRIVDGSMHAAIVRQREVAGTGGVGVGYHENLRLAAVHLLLLSRFCK